MSRHERAGGDGDDGRVGALGPRLLQWLFYTSVIGSIIPVSGIHPSVRVLE